MMEISSPALMNWIMHYGYIGLFCLLMLGIVGVPFPDEFVMTFAGYLIFKGHLHPGPTLIAAFLGTVCGMSLSYAIGRVVGTRLIGRFGHLVHITPEKLASVNAWFERFGKWILVFGYFLTGFRHLVAVVAGATKLKMTAFALFAYSGALIWSLTFISLGYFVGEQWTHVSDHAEMVALILTLLACVGALIYSLKRRGQWGDPA